MDSSLSEMSIGVAGSVGYVTGHPSLSNKQSTIGSDNPLFHGLPLAETQMEQSNISEQMLPTFKRKAPETLSMPQKRVAQMLHRPWLQQMSAQNKKSVQLESMSRSPGSLNSPASNKNLAKSDLFSNKSGSQRTPTQKSQSARTQPFSRGSAESSESVRSKMREQLASALSLVSEKGPKPSQTGNNFPGEAENPPVTRENHKPADDVDNVAKESNDPVENFSAKENDVLGESQKIFPDVSGGFKPSYDLSYEDVPFSENFFVKDELLQGNGLSWVMDPDLEMGDKPKSDGEEVGGGRMGQSRHLSPEDLALEIESELFKLFGGVNKKYKEKGRSLLFNLKDRSNPDLRERVMAGEISPKRLCSMSAEDLASKELSQWRMAKAEELAQMVVLPDTEVDFRRLLRKTHKGEFQVEVEQDDSLPVDVSGGGSSSISRSRPRNNETEVPTRSRWKTSRLGALGEKNNSEQRKISHTLTIPPSEGTDLMQGLMVDDGLKDVDFLPPIVSLDEFMESLDAEPPFENLPLDSERTPTSERDDSEAGSGSKSLDLISKDIIDNFGPTRIKGDSDVKSSDTNVDSKSQDNHSHVKPIDRRVVVKSSENPPKTATALSLPRGDHVWEGSLQLNLSSTANVVGIFKSGEKASANEWPGLIDIKGRVRLDAFEKFLNQLPLSRSRAVMVVHFVLKEGSQENELSSFKEVSESYVDDERVGFAEPASGVELYFCPPHIKTLEMLGKVIPREQIEALNKIKNGLIGVIVWRKLSSTSPKSSSSSHHKHSSKKQQHMTLSSRKQQDSKLNLHQQQQSKPPPPPPAIDRGGGGDDDDDLPPGFGPPGSSRDEDDLPEFNFSSPPIPHFSGNRNPRGTTFHAPLPNSRPVEQVRELIHKYGQQSNGPRDDDDDDDIPEWQPQGPTPSQQVHNFHQPMNRTHYSMPTQHQQPQPSWWAGSGQPDATRGPTVQPGMAWQQNVPKSRGF